MAPEDAAGRRVSEGLTPYQIAAVREMVKMEINIDPRIVAGLLASYDAQAQRAHDLGNELFKLRLATDEGADIPGGPR